MKIIFDPLTGEPTIVAPKRSSRPVETHVNIESSSEGSPSAGSVDNKSEDKKKQVSTISDGGNHDTQHTQTNQEKKENPSCVFCKGNEHLTPPTLYQDSDDWNVRVFENKYKLLDDHEVIVHSPDHTDIEDMSNDDATRIIRAYLNRVSYYEKQDKDVIIFNNRGGKAGASILHPHSQIVAAKGFPGYLENEKSAGLRYYNEHESCFWCDEIAEELSYGKRVVVDSQHYLLFVPKVTRWSYELRLSPKFHRPNFGYISEPEINDLAYVLKLALISYNNLFNRPDRNFWIHTTRYEPYHWHFGFIPHIKVFGALELGAGIWVSDKATSEEAAEQLKNSI